jgi:hypothetical protein
MSDFSIRVVSIPNKLTHGTSLVSENLSKCLRSMPLFCILRLMMTSPPFLLGLMQNELELLSKEQF